MTRARVLLIEDDASIRRFVELALDEQPIELLQAATLARAEQLLRQAGPFCLLITDLMLPDGSGQQLLQTLQAEPALRAGARVAVFSAGLSAERRTALDRLGVDEVIAKPASLGQLIHCVETALSTPAVPQPESSDPRVSAVAHYFGGDQALYDTYRASCLRQFINDRRAGDAALAAGDTAGLRRLAHSLKTVLQTLGHDAESAQAGQLECDAADGRPDAVRQGWDRLGPALDRLAAS